MRIKDNKNYNEIEKYKEINSDLVKDILEQAAKINQEIVLPLATRDEKPCIYENGIGDRLLVIKKHIKNLLKTVGLLYLVIQNMEVKVCLKQ